MKLFSVATYLVGQRYGGPEEGGWWYEAGNLEVLDGHPVQRFASEDAAIESAYALNEVLDRTVNDGRKPIWSVLSDGVYRAIVNEGEPPDVFPEERPHYC